MDVLRQMTLALVLAVNTGKGFTVITTVATLVFVQPAALVPFTV
jgi:hypothetical protein